MVRQNDEGWKCTELQLIDISRREYSQSVVRCEGQQAKFQKRRSRKRRSALNLLRRVAFGILLLCAVKYFIPLFAGEGNVSAAWNFFSCDENLVQGLEKEIFAKHPEWTEDFLTPNIYSRPGYRLKEVKNIFVHYVANPGTSAAQNRSYFEQQKDTHERSVSAHFIIGCEGEIIQCVPLDEIAYAVKTRNYDSVSIECCHPEADGAFTQETYNSLIELLAWLTEAYDLEAEDILRHYDCGGKKCPLYYTEHEEEWEQLKKDVDKL